MRDERAFVVPYDSGHRGLRMGAGPLHLATRLGCPTEVIESRDPFPAEIKTTFELYGQLAERIRATASDSLPIVLSGNCGASVGAAGGVGTDDLALIWFDAHGDFMTPDTTTSGFLDGMGMSVLAGLCWQKLTASVPGFKPLPADRLMHAGGRDFSEGEEDAFTAAGVALVTAPRIRERGLGEVTAVLDAIAKRARRIIVHVDMDVIDPSFGAANRYAAAGGLTPDEIVEVVDACKERFSIAALVIASFDPSFDTKGGITDAALAIVERARA